MRMPLTGRVETQLAGSMIRRTSSVCSASSPETRASCTGPDGRACESMKRFRLGETYTELKAAALLERDLFDESAADAEEDGQSDSLDCSCTD